jgi:hypothetical protein
MRLLSLWSPENRVLQALLSHVKLPPEGVRRQQSAVSIGADGRHLAVVSSLEEVR